jgi:F420-dependent oxidoreductase-like protein
MRFGAFVPQGWRLDLGDVPVARQWDTMVAAARVAEDVGFESVWVYDHFHTFPDLSHQSTWEAWTVMAGLAEATGGIRLGQMCTANSYRSPAYLAKITSCIDVMSGGRLDVGIGAGWYDHEYRGYGYDFPKASVRIGMLDEAVQILKAMWTDDDVTFDGTYYRLDGAINRPKPLQDPHPPLWIAGGGEQLTLRTVARYGDYANYFGDPEVFGHKTDALRGHCEAVGRDMAEITLTRNVDCLIAATDAEVEAKLEQWNKPGSQSKEEWRKNALVGTPAQVVDQVAAAGELGIAYTLVYFVDATWGDGMRLFAQEVIPAFG